MVLHDNKWDRRAKTRYLKKHDLLPVKVEEGPKPKWTGKELSEEDSEEHDQETSETEQQEEQQEKEVLEGADGAKQDDSVVEFEYELEQNQEDAEIVARHIAQFKFEAPKPKHIRYTGDQEEFKEIGDAISHGKLTRNIQQRFGKASYSLPEEDEDDFWESTKATEPKTQTPSIAKGRVEIDSSQQDFLDNLLR